MQYKKVLVFCLISHMNLAVYCSDDPEPVTPDYSPEAKALLEVLYDISGHYTLTGQHNYPNTRDRNTQFAAYYSGKTPVVWSTDWGFAKDGDTDSYLARPNIVDEAIRQHKLGSIITICWHAVPPTADEPVTFRSMPDVNPDSLESVQGQLLDRQFRDVLTPGTLLYTRWCRQVDSVAVYLKKLQKAHVPVLWRPYHEMNGSWFWWGGRVGEYSTSALYRQLFDRLVNHHKLNNLIWVWSVDRPNKPEMNFKDFYPGNEYLDVLALDVYGNDFNQDYYDSLLAISHGKPLALGEVGNPPTPDVLDNQPKWGYYVIWAGMVRNTLKKQYEMLFSNQRILSHEDISYGRIVAPYREVCGLSGLPLNDCKPINLSGEWILNEEKSTLDNFGAGNLPYKMQIVQNDNELIIRRTFIVEYAENRISEEILTLDGSENHSEFWDSPKITTASLSEIKDSLYIHSKVIFNRGNRSFEMITRETWFVNDSGKELTISQYSSSFWGIRKIIMIYMKQLYF